MSSPTKITCIEDAIRIARDFPDWLYRGHANVIAGQPLLPRVFREDFKNEVNSYKCPPGGVEASLAYWFKHAAPSVYKECPQRNDYSGWLALMRHFGVPTRLLDWSESILVALYFATEPIPVAAPAELFFMNGHRLAVRAREEYGDDWSLGKGIKALAQQSQTDKRFWKRKKLTSEEVCKIPLAFSPPLAFPRLAHQLAYFTIHPDPACGKRIEDVLDANLLFRVEIQADKRKSIRRDLVLLGVSQRSLFPDLEGLSKSLLQKLEKWSLCENICE